MVAQYRTVFFERVVISNLTWDIQDTFTHAAISQRWQPPSQLFRLYAESVNSKEHLKAAVFNMTSPPTRHRPGYGRPLPSSVPPVHNKGLELSSRNHEWTQWECDTVAGLFLLSIYFIVNMCELTVCASSHSLGQLTGGRNWPLAALTGTITTNISLI